MGSIVEVMTPAAASLAELINLNRSLTVWGMMPAPEELEEESSRALPNIV